MEEFKKSYAQLNAAQKAAVDTIDGPLLVIAGPGTGKTQLLSLRVANILRKTDADPQNILCLTFTNKAATNMRERLTNLVGPSARGVVVRTFHSFAAEIMNQYPDNFWSGAKLSVAPEAIVDDIIQGILAKLPLNNPLATTFAGSFTALPDVRNGLKLAKEAGLTPTQLKQAIKENLSSIKKIESKLVDILSSPLSIKKLPQLVKQIEKLPDQKVSSTNVILPLKNVLYESLIQSVNQDIETGKTKQTGKWKQRFVQTVNGKKGMFREKARNEWWLALSDVYESYRQQLHIRGYYDYADMLIEVLEQLQKRPDMLADIQERFLYVLIDEFQDTNNAQLRLAHLVADHYAANGRPNIMAVGDDDQAIFAFNGAELNNMLDFKRSYPEAKLIVLTDNYRSSQQVLDAATGIIEQADDRLINRESSLTKKLKANQTFKNKAAVEHVSYPTREHQSNIVAQEVKQLWQEGDRDIAILARTHDSLRHIAEKLSRARVPIRYERQSNILENEAIKELYLIAATAVNIAAGDKDAVNVSIAALIRHQMWQISPKTLWKLAVHNYSNPDWLSSLLDSDDAKLHSIGSWLTWLARNSESLPLPLLMEYIVGLQEGQYLQSPFKEYYLDKQTVDQQFLETLSAINLLLVTIEEFAARQSTLADFVHFVELNLSTNRVIADESWFVTGTSAVQLMTIHKAKGLEFGRVFLVDAVESVWRPRIGSRGTPANLRLQAYGESNDDYVRLLYVAVTRAKQSFTATSYSLNEKGEKILASPLLASLPVIEIDKPIVNSKEVLESNLRWPALSAQNEKAMLSERLSSYSLSPTGFIDFLNIAEAGPQSFKERQLLRLPHPRSLAGSYGTAIHGALETAQRLVNTSKLTVEPVIDRFESELSKQHLAPNDFERFMKRGETLLPLLLKESDQLLPKGGQSEQKISDIVIGRAKLNGKLDRIDKNGSSVIIGDYKTGKPLKSFETKDQTKAVKAWRHKTQLLFYTLLVKNSARFAANHIVGQMIYVEAEDKRQLKLELTPTNDELKRLEQLIARVWKKIMDLDFPDISKYPQTIEGIKQFEDDLLNGKI